MCAVRVLRTDGSECDCHELGRIVIKLPLPPGVMSNLYKATQRFLQIYFSTYPVSILQCQMCSVGRWLIQCLKWNGGSILRRFLVLRPAVQWRFLGSGLRDLFDFAWSRQMLYILYLREIHLSKSKFFIYKFTYILPALLNFLHIQGYYDTMDAGYRDEFGYIYVTARDDDVINVSGHRLSTSALEDVVLGHPEVADAAVVGVPEPTKGEIPLCLFVLKNGNKRKYKCVNIIFKFLYRSFILFKYNNNLALQYIQIVINLTGVFFFFLQQDTFKCKPFRLWLHVYQNNTQ